MEDSWAIVGHSEEEFIHVLLKPRRLGGIADSVIGWESCLETKPTLNDFYLEVMGTTVFPREPVPM